MITTVLIAGLVQWDWVHRAAIHDRWYAWGDHGLYSPIAYGGI